ncbi:uncharacterized protein LOC119742534 [Patiria miniata]|uniref:Sugar phosphate transporter domain-containing protein n=1 Tax=Patiria miniata TaxID=46514 RepID=A0A914BEH2_PATMI|nr:uncharacterized protein LOC119742534 [Patiria miniata]
MATVVLFVAVWWIANMVATIASKKAVSGIKPDATDSLTTWTGTVALKDLRWIELTMLQHLLGALLANTWLLVVRRKSVFPKESLNPKHMLLAVTGNLVGNLGTNASFAAVSSSLTQVIKSCEPIFTFVFALLFYKNSGNLTRNVLFSIIAMVVGTCLFISGEVSFNIWGLGAAVISNIAFPIRNIYLKKLGQSWDDPLQKIAVVSNLNVLILLPFAIMSMSSLAKLPPMESCTSATFHFIYNAASIMVLQAFSPVEHAMLNLSKRMFVILANMIVFSTPFTFWTVTGLLVIFIGHYNNQGGRIFMQIMKMRRCFSPAIIVFGISSFCWFVGFFRSGALMNQLQMQLTRYQPREVITTAWVYERPIPYNVVENIEAFLDRNPGMTVKVFCGTSQCMKAVQDTHNPEITGEFLVLPEIFKNTPLELWLARHPMHKILTGVDFEDHVYEAVRLALLWRHGGIHFDPSIKHGEFTIPGHQEAWVSIGTNLTQTKTHGVLSVSRFPVHSAFIANLTKAFCREYSRNITHGNPHSLQKFDFQGAVSDMFNKSCMSGDHCPTHIETDLERISVVDARRRHFGTLSYARRAGRSTRANLGDEVQSFPGIQFLPFVDRFVDRDNFDKAKRDNHIRMFFNAWYGDQGMTWPPPRNIDPIMLSVHISPRIRPMFTKYIKYLRSKEPIGCRDSDTLKFLKQNNVDVFLSGCLTLLIKTPNIENKRSGQIVLADVDKAFAALLPPDIERIAIRVTHLGVGGGKSTIRERFQAAYDLIQNYSEAHVVITQRIHCALPCVAMGTPLIFINSKHMPGGGAERGLKVSSRVTGLTPLFHTVDAFNMSQESIARWLRDFNWRNPPPNPDVSMRMRLRATDWNVIRQDQVLYDSARKFGLLPLSPPATNTPNQLVFHLILNRTRNPTSLDWPKWRTIESIFYHYPHAKIIIHSDSLQTGQFDVLTESGYTIEVHSLSASIGNNIMKNKIDIKHFRRFGSRLNEEDFAKLAVLFQWGGVYIDADVILLRQLDLSLINTLVWGSKEQNSFDLSFMRFERGHPFLETILKASEWQASPKDRHFSAFEALLFHTWSNYFKNSVKVLAQRDFFKQFSAQNARDCLQSTSGPIFESNMKQIRREVVFAKVKGSLTNLSKLQNGTICKYLFNSFCVLCNNVY